MDPGVVGTFIPIVAIVFGVGIGALALWAEHKRKAQLLEQLHKERLAALEKGVEMPPLTPGLVGFLEGGGPKPAKPPVLISALWPRAMRSGLILLFIGVVMYYGTMRAGGEEGAIFTLIPAVIGVANLIYAAVLWHQDRNARARAEAFDKPLP